MTLAGTKQKHTDARTPTEHDARVGERIRILRLERGLSQTELGAAVGVTFQQMQKYEKGGNRIAASRLVQIADQLEVSPAYLLTGSDNRRKEGDTIVERMLAELHGHKLAAAFMSIEDRKVKADIAMFIDAYAAALKRKRR